MMKDILFWFDENYEKTDEECILELKEVFRNFQISNFYLKLSPKERRKNNLKYFKGKIIEDIELRKCFHSRFKQKYSIISGFKCKKLL